jgi:magnesium-protoporphyrin O-methyltransferase
MADRRPCTEGCCVNTFSSKEAENDLRRYRRQGPDGTTRSLIDAITAAGIEGATILDVGGGIGAIQLELLAAGAAKATSVDASEAYVAVARAEAIRRGLADRTDQRIGAFEVLAPVLDAADVVTLDRVVCCDPDLPGLLGAAAGHARRMVGLVYPRVTWWNRLAARGMAAWSWITRDTTRWHLHPVEDIDAILRRAGFERRDVSRTLLWHVALYTRT